MTDEQFLADEQARRNQDEARMIERIRQMDASMSDERRAELLAEIQRIGDKQLEAHNADFHRGANWTPTIWSHPEYCAALGYCRDHR